MPNAPLSDPLDMKRIRLLEEQARLQAGSFQGQPFYYYVLPSYQQLSWSYPDIFAPSVAQGSTLPYPSSPSTTEKRPPHKITPSGLFEDLYQLSNEEPDNL